MVWVPPKSLHLSKDQQCTHVRMTMVTMRSMGRSSLTLLFQACKLCVKRVARIQCVAQQVLNSEFISQGPYSNIRPTNSSISPTIPTATTAPTHPISYHLDRSTRSNRHGPKAQQQICNKYNSPASFGPNRIRAPFRVNLLMACQIRKTIRHKHQIY